MRLRKKKGILEIEDKILYDIRLESLTSCLEKLSLEYNEVIYDAEEADEEDDLETDLKVNRHAEAISWKSASKEKFMSYVQMRQENDTLLLEKYSDIGFRKMRCQRYLQRQVIFILILLESGESHDPGIKIRL